MRETFTLGELAELATNSDVGMMRQMLRSVGADSEVHVMNPAEEVDRGWVVDLLALHASDPVRRALRQV